MIQFMILIADGDHKIFEILFDLGGIIFMVALDWWFDPCA